MRSETIYRCQSEHVSGAERSAIPAPRSGGCPLIRSAAQRCARALRSKPLRAHLKFPAAPAKSLHAPLKFLGEIIF